MNIVIPVFNRPSLTRMTIEKARFFFPRPHIITVVDNGSDFDTQNLLLNLKSKKRIDYLFRLEQNYGVSVASNIGWNLIDSSMYMKLDNDIVFFSSEWFSKLEPIWKKYKQKCVIGADIYNRMNNPLFVKNSNGFIGETSNHISGGAICIPKKVSDIIGYWNEDYGLYGCEDDDYGSRLYYSSISQFYFNPDSFMGHFGKDIKEMKEKYNLDKIEKQKENQRLYQTNSFLYKRGIRKSILPFRFSPIKWDGYVLTIVENEEYIDIFQSLLRLNELFLFYSENSKEIKEYIDIFIQKQNKGNEKSFCVAKENYLRIKNLLV